MHPVDQRHRRALERFGGRHIGEDHELLDQTVRLQPRRRDHAVDGAVGFEQDLALRQVEIERGTLVARPLDRLIGGVKRLQHRRDQRLRVLVGAAADRLLGLHVAQLGD